MTTDCLKLISFEWSYFITNFLKIPAALGIDFQEFLSLCTQNLTLFTCCFICCLLSFPSAASAATSKASFTPLLEVFAEVSTYVGAPSCLATARACNKNWCVSKTVWQWPFWFYQWFYWLCITQIERFNNCLVWKRKKQSRIL